MDATSPHRPRPRVWRWLSVAVALALVANLVAAVVLAGSLRSVAPDAGAPARGPSAPHARPLPGDPGARQYPDPAAVRRVRDLMGHRAEAVRNGDRAAFLATVDPDAPRLRARQRRLFVNLSRIPLAHWSYDVSAAGATGATAPGRRADPDPSTWTPRVTLHYQLQGFDEQVITRTRHLTFSRDPDRGWVVGGDGSGHRRKPAIWDTGELRVVTTGHTLVLGTGTSGKLLETIAQRVERAVSVVSGVWGDQWTQRAVVVVPPNRKAAVAISGGRQSLARIAGLARVVSGPGGAPPAGSGDRILVVPDNFTRLTEVGRRVVLTHELTHVATRGATGQAIPMWLVEGFADYVGYRAVDVPVRTAATELADAVQAGRVPRRLPVRSDFAAGSSQLSFAYEAAWLACRLIALRYGEEQLVAFYRDMGSRRGSPHRVAAEAFAEVLGTSRASFTSEWRSYVRAQLA